MKLLRIATALTLVAATVGCVRIDSSSLTDNFDKIVPLAAGGEISIANINGAVRVATWDRPEVRIEAVKKARGGNTEHARERLANTEIDIATVGDRLSISTRKTPAGHGLLNWMFGNNGAIQVTYTITVPSHANVEATTVNGRVEVKDLAGRVKAETVNGSIHVTGIAGSVDAETINGAIEVALAALAGDHPMSLTTVNGGITLTLPTSARASLEADVTNGSIDCDLALAQKEKSRRHLSGELSGGGVKIDLSTTNGGIDILGG